MINLRRHVGTTLWTGLVVPPAASLVLLATVLLPHSTTRDGPAAAMVSFLALDFIFGVPVGYVFGGIPALLAGAIYSAVLTMVPVVEPRRLLRGGVGAMCGGLAGGIWFHTIVGPGWSSYAIGEALTMLPFALCRPGSGPWRVITASVRTQRIGQALSQEWR